MLTKVRAYSSWQTAETLPLDENGRIETDLLQIRDVTGLGPVDANINTSPIGSIDGESYIGSNVSSRNIVLTIRPNPDWKTWSFERLRRLLYTYFMPKMLTRLVFETDEISPVEIFGYVETFEPVIFSKDGEMQISIICPDPYFTAVEPIVVTGLSSPDGANPVIIEYNGSVEIGINVQVTQTFLEREEGQPAPQVTVPTLINIQVGDPLLTYFRVAASVDSTKYFLMNSIPGQKFVQNIALGSGVITNLLSVVQEGSIWPTLEPGSNKFSVITNGGSQDWKLTYYERFGGL